MEFMLQGVTSRMITRLLTMLELLTTTCLRNQLYYLPMLTLQCHPSKLRAPPSEVFIDRQGAAALELEADTRNLPDFCTPT